MKRVYQRQSGTVLVESALTLLLFFVLLIGILEAGRFLNVQHTLTMAARQGARLGVAPITKTSTLPSTQEIEDEVNQWLSASNISGANINVERPVVIDTGGVPSEFTRVSVSLPYEVMTISMFSKLQVTLKGEALMRNETSP